MRGSFFPGGPGALLFAALFALAPAAPAVAGEAAAPAEAWSPLRVFIGSWSGSSTAGKVTRQFESSSDNRHLVVLEKAGKAEVAPWGDIAWDAARQALVLDPAADGTELVLQPADASGKVVFASSKDGAGATRLSYEVVGWNELVERLEVAGADGKLALARETRFKRGSSKLALKPGTAGEAGRTATR